MSFSEMEIFSQILKLSRMIVWFPSCSYSLHAGFFVNGRVVVYWSLPMFPQWQEFFISSHSRVPGQLNDSSKGVTKTAPLWSVIPQNVGLLFLFLLVRRIVINIYCARDIKYFTYFKFSLQMKKQSLTDIE